MQFRNKKNGHLYNYINEAINCTNADDGTIMVIYSRAGKIFVREKEEFFNKFEKSPKIV